ncbi:MAG: beta-ketoacyl-ACP synthase II [Deltaproteobacteria bacterium]|nr:beta-ketoacyl-ACP synthase II [Deltaproteobacteria bacterium]
MRRVAVTGLGLLTPVGNNVPDTWAALLKGVCGVGPITRFDASKIPVRIAGEVKGFKAEPWLTSKDTKRMGLFIQYAMVASYEALADAGLKGRFGETEAAKEVAPERVGVSISAGMGGLPEIQEWDRELATKEKKTTTPFFIPMIIPNMAGGQLSIAVNAQGPNTCIVTACASSTHAIGESARLIQRGDADVMICGGAEAVICELGIAAFASMKALSTRNDEPARASRPYDRDRDGFVLGEGAGILVLEDWDHANRRGARIYAEVMGYGLNADAYHMTSPAPEARGAEKCMRLAIADAGIDASEIGYVNSHGTSTPAGDGMEAQAIAKVFEASKKSLHVSSTKSMTGHLLGAAGGAEAAFTALAIHHGMIPPTINLENLDEESAATGLHFTAKTAVRKSLKYALSNSFGFGGTNASLILGKPI